MTFEQRLPIILNLGFQESAIPKLKAYIEFLWDSNEKLNLFSRKMSFEELLDNHLIDCLLPLKHFPADVAAVADFGSGGGLPGVIYAINFPDIRFRLYEKSPLKQDFLRKCQAFAPNLTVEGEIPLELKNIDLVISRAFKPLDVILEMSRFYYQNQGRYFLLKGRKEKVDEEIALAQKKFKNLKVEVLALNSPILEVERHLLLI